MTLHRRACLWLPALLLATRPAAAASPATASGSSTDPYASPVWPELQRSLAGDAPVRFDERVQVLAPAFAEDPMQVPLSIHVDPSLGAVDRIVVVVDRNPIRRVVEFEPLQALPRLGLRFKLEQASPVRAAVRLANGSWVVGSAWVDASGGGCTVAGATRRDGSWSRTLGATSARLFSRGADPGSRLRVQVMHPMDTGLVAGIPAFHVTRLAVRDAGGRELARLQTWEPVSENPMFSFDFGSRLPAGVRLVGQDNNGNRIGWRLQ